MKLINREIGLGLDLLQYLYDKSGTVTAARMASALEESELFIQKVLNKLKRRGLVDAVRGPGGGFRFRPGTEETTLKSFFETLDRQYSQSIFDKRTASDITSRLLNDTLATTRLREVIINGH